MATFIALSYTYKTPSLDHTNDIDTSQKPHFQKPTATIPSGRQIEKSESKPSNYVIVFEMRFFLAENESPLFLNHLQKYTASVSVSQPGTKKRPFVLFSAWYKKVIIIATSDRSLPMTTTPLPFAELAQYRDYVPGAVAYGSCGGGRDTETRKE